MKRGRRRRSESIKPKNRTTRNKIHHWYQRRKNKAAKEMKRHFQGFHFGSEGHGRTSTATSFIELHAGEEMYTPERQYQCQRTTTMQNRTASNYQQIHSQYQQRNVSAAPPEAHRDWNNRLSMYSSTRGETHGRNEGGRERGQTTGGWRRF